jgi:hypothetical protein
MENVNTVRMQGKTEKIGERQMNSEQGTNLNVTQMIPETNTRLRIVPKSEVILLVDAIGKLHDKIATLTEEKTENRKKLEEIVIPQGVKKIEGTTHDIEFRDRDDTYVKPEDMMTWLELNDKVDDYFKVVFKVLVSEVKTKLGEDVLQELATIAHREFAAMFVSKKKNVKNGRR